MTPEEVRAWRKAERARLIAERQSVPIEQRRTVRERIRSMVGSVPELQGVTVGFYWPFRGEIDPGGLMRDLMARGTQPALPVVVE
jgi:5-formyltetrahydrofolate cyclo-ligase